MKTILTLILFTALARADIFVPTLVNPDFEEGTNGWVITGGASIVDHIPMGPRPPDPPLGNYIGLLGMTAGTVSQSVPYVAGVTNRFTVRCRSAHTRSPRTFFLHWQGWLPSREHYWIAFRTSGTEWVDFTWDVAPIEQLSSLARIAVYGDCAAFEMVNETPEPEPEHDLVIDPMDWRTIGQARIGNDSVIFGQRISGVVQSVTFVPGVINRLNIDCRSRIISPRWLTVEFEPVDWSQRIRKVFMTPHGRDGWGRMTIELTPSECSTTSALLYILGDNAELRFQ